VEFHISNVTKATFRRISLLLLGGILVTKGDISYIISGIFDIKSGNSRLLAFILCHI